MKFSFSSLLIIILLNLDTQTEMKIQNFWISCNQTSKIENKQETPDEPKSTTNQETQQTYSSASPSYYKYNYIDYMKIIY